MQRVVLHDLVQDVHSTMTGGKEKSFGVVAIVAVVQGLNDAGVKVLAGEGQAAQLGNLEMFGNAIKHLLRKIAGEYLVLGFGSHDEDDA
ncbi:hypothetical protein PG989_004726 [Apiospora arundinis]